MMKLVPFEDEEVTPENTSSLSPQGGDKMRRALQARKRALARI